MIDKFWILRWFIAYWFLENDASLCLEGWGGGIGCLVFFLFVCVDFNLVHNFLIGVGTSYWKVKVNGIPLKGQGDLLMSRSNL